MIGARWNAVQSEVRGRIALAHVHEGMVIEMDALIIDAVRTPVGKLRGALSAVRPDDLGAYVIEQLLARNPAAQPGAVDEVVFGCANQAGEDNRNVARMPLLLAGWPKEVSGTTVNRLCGSSMDAVATAARAIRSGEVELVIAGGVESMARAPFVMGKADGAYSRAMKLEDTTMGSRFVIPLMKSKYGVETMPETGEIVAEEFHVTRKDQDAFSLRSQQRAAEAIRAGRLKQEIIPVGIPQKKGDTLLFS